MSSIENNFETPKSRKEIGELIAKFKISSEVPKTREEIVEFIKLIKKPYLEEKKKLKELKLQDESNSGKPKSNSRKEIGELIAIFKTSSDLPKTRQEIVEYIDSIKKSDKVNKFGNTNSTSTPSDENKLKTNRLHRGKRSEQTNTTALNTSSVNNLLLLNKFQLKRIVVIVVITTVIKVKELKKRLQD